MGRHNRRTIYHHAIREEDGNHQRTTYIGGKTWCGEDYGLSDNMSNMHEGEDRLAFTRRTTDCPKCAGAIGKLRMTQIADRVRLEAAEDDLLKGTYGRKYRGLYRVFIDGVHRAWIVMQNGWGNPWELHELTDRDEAWRPYGSLVSDMPGKHSRCDVDRTFQRVHFYSKEMMASAALRLREKDPRNLPTIPEIQARREADRQQRQQEEAERAENRRLAGIEADRKAALRAERKALALEGLDEIAKGELTNMERAALEAALDIINGKDVA